MNELIQKVFEEIRPYIQSDGGDIEFAGFDETTGTVSVRLHGACVGCAISHVTLYQGVERMLKERIPEVKAVAVLDDD
jgi:Fe-S cluster biogenesis protein NfuA